MAKVFKIKKIFTFFITFILIENGRGGDLLPGSGFNNFKVFSIEHGLPQSTVYCILQDKRGYIWVGTEGAGVCRFDGRSFKAFNNKHGLAGNNIRCLLEDSRGILWIGSDKGLTYYDGLRFHIVNAEDGLSGNTVLSLIEDYKHNIWAGTDDGGVNRISLLKNDSVRIKTITSKDGLTSDFIFDIYEDPRHRIWLATLYGGLNILSFGKNGSTIEALRKDNQIPSDLIVTMEADKEGNLWCGTYDVGAFKIVNPFSDNTGMVLSYNPSNGLNDIIIWDIHCDKEGDIWFGTNENGVVRFHKNQIITYNDKNGLPNKQILSISQDQEGNIWFGSNGNGLIEYMGDHFSHFTEKNGLSGSNIYDIAEDGSGNIWIGSQGGGINLLLFHDNRVITRVYTTREGLADNNVKTITQDQAGYFWVGTDNGISRFKPDELISQKNGFTSITTRQGILDNKVKIILADTRGNIWIGGKLGITVITGDRLFYLTEEQGLPSNDIQSLFEDLSGNVWIGTLGGLARYDFKTMRTFDEKEGLMDKRVNTLTEDPGGNIWIGTDGGGIYFFDAHTTDTVPIRFFADDSILNSNIIYSLAFLDSTILIAGSNKGFNAVYLDRNHKPVKVKSYDNSNGFLGVENNQNAIFRDSRQNIWFGTIKGVSRFNPSMEKMTDTPPLIHITDLKLFYKTIDWKTRTDSIAPWFLLPKGIVLSYSDNHLTFSYSGLSYTNPQRVLYRYRLEGHETEWSPLRKEMEITYSGIQPGEYTFAVTAMNENGVLSEKPARFQFVITPPWYRTLWFYIVCTVSLVVSIVLFIKIRERNLKEEKRILEQLVTERTREVVMQKDVIEEKNKTLSQANIEILKQKHTIEEKNKDITDSINYAKRIQQSLLPRDEDVRHLIPNSFILFRPKDIVSGDFYWLTQKENTVYFTASDCTGHGVPGAFVSMINMELLNEAINVKAILKPGEVFDEVRKGLIRALKQTGAIGQQKDGMDSALCALTMKGDGKAVLQCAGGNNAVFIVRKTESPLEVTSENKLSGEKKELLELQSGRDGFFIYEVPHNKQPIGISDKLDPFTTYRMELDAGDTIYMSTDGYEDQFGGPKGKKFMRKNLKELWLSMQNISIFDQKEILDKTFTDWVGDIGQLDDVCIIGVRV